MLRPVPDDAFTISKEDDVYVVHGKRVERAVGMTNQDSEESMDRLQVTLRKMGVTKGIRRGWRHRWRYRPLRQNRIILG